MCLNPRRVVLIHFHDNARLASAHQQSSVLVLMFHIVAFERENFTTNFAVPALHCCILLQPN